MRILILKPQEICYGIMDVIADNLGKALSRTGVAVLYFDMKKEPVENLAQYAGGKYAAVIDVYSGLLSVTIPQGNSFWSCVDAPVYQICVDFPVYIRNKMSADLHRYFVLCMDRHYCGVVRECMPNVTDAFFFPMAGTEGGKKKSWEERRHDLVFIGSYTDYRGWLASLERCEAGIKRLGYALFDTMCRHTELDQKQAFERTLAQMNIRLKTEEFYQWFQTIDGIAMSAAAYQREQVVRTLLEAGLQVEVYGNSWEKAPFAHDENLIVHEQVDEAGYISVLEDTKLSLNIMYCNKAGYSERYSYSMLNGAVCVSDTSEYLEEEFADGEDIVFYRLDRLTELPDRVRRLLECPDDAKRIADAAYGKAKHRHTWEARAEQFLKLLREER